MKRGKIKWQPIILRQLSLIVVCCLNASIVLGQAFTVSGVVIDKNSSETLPYATIRVYDNTLGTVSNLSGAFDFHVPTELMKGQLQISMLGYETLLISLLEVRGQNITQFELTPSVRVLNEVVVADSLTGGEIFQLALAKIESNYPMEPVLMDGFYRDIKKVGDKHEALLEAAIVIYDKNYKAPRDYTKLRERVGIVQIRKSFDYKPALTTYFDQYNILEDLLLENSVKYRSFNDEPEFYNNLKRETVLGFNNELMYLISLEVPGYDLKMYIDKKTYAFYKVEFGWGDMETPIFTTKSSRKLENHVMRLDKVVEFEPYNGKFYLKYIRARYLNHWIDMETNTLETTTELFQELVINDVEIDNPEWVSSSEKMKRYGLQYQNNSYDEAFWKNYNVIKSSPLDAKILEDLEKEASLQTQFKNN
jgi:hypothetical protein